MTWLERMGRGLHLMLAPLVLVLLIAPALFIEVWTDKTFMVSHGTFILTVGWVLIVVGAIARALQGLPVFGGGASITRLWLGLLATWILITSLLAYQPAVTWFGAAAVLTYLLLAQTVLDWLELNARRGRWLLAGLAAVVGVQTLIGVLQYFKVPFKPLADAVPVLTSADGRVLPGGSWLHDLLFSLSQIASQGVVVGTLGNYNYLAEFLVLALPVMVGAALSVRTALLRWVALGALASSFLVLVSTGGRGALLGLVVGGVAAALVIFGRAWLNPRQWWKSKQARVAVVVGMVLLAGAVALGGGRVQTKLTAILSGSDASIESRLINWKVAGLMVLDRPVFGTGVGGYKLLNVERLASAYPDGVPEAAVMSRFHQAHNEPLQATVELGIPGLLLILAALLAWVREVRANEALSRPLRFGLLWGAGALMVAGSFGFPLHIPLTALALMLMLVLGLTPRVPPTVTPLAVSYRPVYALVALTVLGAAGTLVFQKQVWPAYMAQRYVKLGEQLVKGDRKSEAVPAVLALANRQMTFKGEAAVPEMKILLERGQYEAALRVYDESEARGLGMDALYWKGRALEKLGRREEAEATLARVVRFYPENEAHHIMSKRVLKRLKREAPLPPDER